MTLSSYEKAHFLEVDGLVGMAVFHLLTAKIFFKEMVSSFLRKRRLENMHQTLNTVVDAIPEGLIILDEGGTEVKRNTAFTKKICQNEKLENVSFSSPDLP